MKRFVILPYAETDIKDTVHFYKARTEGFEKDFIKLIDASFLKISNNPEGFPKVKYDIRKFVVPKYSFCIYYVDRAEVLYILAIFHDRRNPKNWQKRRLIKL